MTANSSNGKRRHSSKSMDAESPPHVYRTQRIILDNNSYSNRLLHTALTYAEVAKACNFADIKIVFTPMLLAEINHAQRMHDNKTIRPGSGFGKSARRGGGGSIPELGELLDAYGEHIEISMGADTEKRVKNLMWEYLMDMHTDHPDYFYSLLHLPKDSMANPKRELAEMMDNPEGFINIFHACLQGNFFRDALLATNPTADLDTGPTKDLADDSIVEWYKGHLAKTPAPDNDVILVSCDQELLRRMKSKHNRAYPGKANNLDHFDHFDQTAFARHVLEELNAIRRHEGGRHYRRDVTYMGINAGMDMCNFLIRTKKPGTPTPNEHLIPRSRW